MNVALPVDTLTVKIQTSSPGIQFLAPTCGLRLCTDSVEVIPKRREALIQMRLRQLPFHA
jgi:hypothetical protein